MGIIGKIIGSEMAENQDSGGDVLMLIVELTEPGDKQAVEHFRLSGIDCKPPLNSHVLVEEAGSFLIAASVDDGIEQESAEGEIEIYGSDDGSKTSRVKCETGGDVILNEGTKGAAREDHAITITADTDPAFFLWIAAVSTFCGGLVPPSTITGKISEGEDTVKIP